MSLKESGRISLMFPSAFTRDLITEGMIHQVQKLSKQNLDVFGNKNRLLMDLNSRSSTFVIYGPVQVK